MVAISKDSLKDCFEKVNIERMDTQFLLTFYMTIFSAIFYQ